MRRESDGDQRFNLERDVLRGQPDERELWERSALRGVRRLGGNGTVGVRELRPTECQRVVAGQCRNDVDDWQSGITVEGDRTGQDRLQQLVWRAAERGRDQPGDDIGECQQAEQFMWSRSPSPTRDWSRVRWELST